MSHPLPNLLETTLQKLREMVDVNSVMGDPIQTPEGITILPVCKVSYGFGGGGSDFSTKNQTKQEYPFGGRYRRWGENDSGGVSGDQGRVGSSAAGGYTGRLRRRAGGGSGARSGG